MSYNFQEYLKIKVQMSGWSVYCRAARILRKVFVHYSTHLNFCLKHNTSNKQLVWSYLICIDPKCSLSYHRYVVSRVRRFVQTVYACVKYYNKLYTSYIILYSQWYFTEARYNNTFDIRINISIKIYKLAEKFILGIPTCSLAYIVA